MMPARIASTSAEEQIKEIVGSGPFRFARDEWQPGEQVVYVRNADYHARDETPSGSTGGKKVYLDKVIWRYVPDPWDAADDLAAGKVDWWQEPSFDFMPKIEQNPDLQTFVFDPLGVQGWLRPNFLHPPFNNKKAREALVHMMDQVTYLAWAISQSQYYRSCDSVFACGGTYATRAGAEPMMKHDLARARQLVRSRATTAGRSWCSTSPTGRSSTPQRSSRANGWSRLASRSSSRRWIGRRTWSRGGPRSRLTRAAGTGFTQGGRRQPSWSRPPTSGWRALAR